MLNGFAVLPRILHLSAELYYYLHAFLFQAESRVIVVLLILLPPASKKFLEHSRCPWFWKWKLDTNRPLEEQFFWEGRGVVVGMTVSGIIGGLLVQFRKEQHHSLKP